MEDPKTVINLKIKGGRTFADFVMAAKVLFWLTLFLAFFALLQYALCKHENPEKTVTQCLRTERLNF